VYSFPPNIDELAYKLFKNENPPPSLRPPSLWPLLGREGTDNTIIVHLEQSPLMFFGRVLRWGRFLNDGEIELVKKRVHYESPVVVI
jgi:hypothetical protein